MATTYTLISKTIITTPTNNVIFSSIPTTYTDLVLKMSIRDTNGTTFVTGYSYYPTNASITQLTGNGATAASARASAAANAEAYNAYPAANSTSNTFGSWELYIPNYATSMAHPVSSFSVSENNATTAYIAATAILVSTGTITQVQFVDGAGDQFATGSSFYLYGISNA